MNLLEKAWEQREEYIYKEIFSDVGPGIYPLSYESFAQFNEPNIDPRWLTIGVFECPPSDGRQSWVYITSGMSNPWENDQPEEYSGLGTEFIIETNEKEPWVISLLHTVIAYNLLLASGQMGDYPLLSHGARLPLSISEQMGALLFTEPHSFPYEFNICSGKVDLIQIVSITADELAFTKKHSSELLTNKLISTFGNLVTSKNRPSAIPFT